MEEKGEMKRVILSLNFFVHILFFDNHLEKFIESLDSGTVARVIRIIELLEKFGNQLELPHSRSLGKGLFELRIRGKQEVRIFYIFYQNEIVLLHGFLKKTQQISKREIISVLKKKKYVDGI